MMIYLNGLYTDAVSASSDKLPTPVEKLMDKMHCGAISYYHHKTRQDPRLIPIPFPAQRVCIYHQSNPIVTNISEFLQESEREKEREDYFESKFNIEKKD